MSAPGSHSPEYFGIDDPKPGDVAIATVRHRGFTAEGVLVRREADGQTWRSMQTVGQVYLFFDNEVTVTSRAVVVTEADRDELIATVAVEHGWADWYAKKIRTWFDALLGGGR